MADHGTRQSYADGCRCLSCKGAQSQYRRDHKLRQAAEALGVESDLPAPKQGRPSKAELAARALAAAPVVAPSVSQRVGDTEQAVLDELATLSSPETRKTAAAGAITLGQIADNPLESGANRRAAVQAAVEIVDELRRGSSRRKGRLASVQAMTRKPGSSEAAG